VGVSVCAAMHVIYILTYLLYIHAGEGKKMRNLERIKKITTTEFSSLLRGNMHTYVHTYMHTTYKLFAER
jgi:hypothetical protein